MSKLLCNVLKLSGEANAPPGCAPALSALQDRISKFVDMICIFFYASGFQPFSCSDPFCDPIYPNDPLPKIFSQAYVMHLYWAWSSAEIFSVHGQRRHFAYNFQVADNAVQMDIHKALLFLHHEENDPCYGSNHKKCGSLAEIPRTQVYCNNLHSRSESPNFFVRGPHKLLLKVSRAGRHSHT